jgi:endoglucanase
MTGASSGGVCMCVSGFSYNATSARCEIICSGTYAAGAGNGLNTCTCISGFNWNSTSLRCEINCTIANAAGVGNALSTCTCSSGFQWNPITLTCDVQGASTGWKTSGSQVITPTGQTIILKSISWFGFETSNYVVHGLWTRKMEDILTVVKNLGFNSLRIPWCDDIIANPAPNSIDYNSNPNLVGLSSLQVLDYLIDRCNELGLNIILDRHRPTSAGQSELWYVSGVVSEAQWIQHWVFLANRYINNSNVIAADLHNEPHGSATWGTSSPSTDWNKAAERCGNALLAVVPNWLIIVEGIEIYNSVSYWWGGSLQGVQQTPVQLNVPNKVIYSPHDYGSGVYNQPWFSDPTFPANLNSVWYNRWSYIHLSGIAPVWIGEFGGYNSDTTSNEGQWQNHLVDYIKNNSLHWSYWCVNPDSGDTGGILLNDWTTLDQSKVTMLNRILQ